MQDFPISRISVGGFMPQFVLLSLLAVALFASQGFAAVPCETLSTLTLPNTTITMAQVVDAGKFVAPAPARGAAPAAGARGGNADAPANNAAPAGDRGGRGGQRGAALFAG